MERFDRRELLVRAGGLTLAAGTVGVGPALARWDGLPLGELARTLDGTIVARGAAGYAHARLLVSTRFDAVHPKAVVFCESVADVQKTVHWARRHHVHIVARSGGHSYGGYSTTPGVVIDMSRITGLHVDAAGRIATVGAGAVDRRLQRPLASRADDPGRQLPHGRDRGTDPRRRRRFLGAQARPYLRPA